jgi:hypothetical protein
MLFLINKLSTSNQLLEETFVVFKCNQNLVSLIYSFSMSSNLEVFVMHSTSLFFHVGQQVLQHYHTPKLKNIY